MGISSVLFIKDVLEVSKLFLLKVVERSGISKDDLYRRVNNSNLRYLSPKTTTDLDSAIIKGDAADIIEISTLIIHLNIASDFKKGSEFEGKLYDDVRAVRSIRNKLKHTASLLSNEECNGYLEELKDLAVRFENHLNAAPNKYLHLVHEISIKRRQHLIVDALRKKYCLQKIQLREERENPFQCIDIYPSEHMSEDIPRSYNSKVRPVELRLDVKKDESVEKDWDEERNRQSNAKRKVQGIAETKTQGNAKRKIQDREETTIQCYAKGKIPDKTETKVQDNAKGKIQDISDKKIQTKTSMDKEAERLFEKYSKDCKPHPMKNESRPKKIDKEMIPSNTVWHKTETDKCVKLKEQKSFPFMEDKVDILFFEEEGEKNNYDNLKEDLEETGITMMSSREVSLPGRPVLDKLTQIKPSLVLLERETISSLQAYQLHVGLKYHNKATFLLLSLLKRAKKPSIQIRKFGLSGNYKYDLLLCYCPNHAYDREKAIRIKSMINAAIDDVSVKLYEEVATPGGFKFGHPPKSKKFLILISKGMIGSRSLIHEIENFIVGKANEDLLPQDYFVLVVDDHAEVPKSFIGIKQFPLANIEDFIDWYKRS